MHLEYAGMTTNERLTAVGLGAASPGFRGLAPPGWVADLRLRGSA